MYDDHDPADAPTNNGVYLIYYKKGNETWGTLDIRVGVNEKKLSAFEINIFPNPASNFFTLTISNSENKNISLLLANILGQKVFSEDALRSTTQSRSTSSFQIDASRLSSGIYFLQIDIGGEKVFRKIAKE